MIRRLKAQSQNHFLISF
jgi:T-complex protein 1 subunit beta